MARYIFIFLLVSALATTAQVRSVSHQIDYWVTKGDRSQLLAHGSAPWLLDSRSKPTITIDAGIKFQSVDGFGYTLTGGSAALIRQLPESQRKSLLEELFGQGPGSLHISYLRVSIGSSDLDGRVFSYDDRPEGEADAGLHHFSLSDDTVHLVPLLQEILRIHPSIKILGSPWSPPLWMKDNRNSKGGSLLPAYYDAYAQYFIRYIDAMRANGIRIDAVTPQNEPLHPGNNPSLYMPAEQQRDFIRDHLGPAFEKAGVTTKIIVYDHNCNKPEYPLTILNDPAAKKYIDGSAFHLYEGEISALSRVHEAHPERGVYFTEQWTGAKGDFDGDLFWHIRNVIIGSMRNWSRIALEWNVANDPNYEPHTPGGCTECKGALTIDGEKIDRNVSYYIIAHASRFVPAGSVRIESRGPDDVPQVAFLTPEGKLVLIVLNDGSQDREIALLSGKRSVHLTIPNRSVMTVELN